VTTLSVYAAMCLGVAPPHRARGAQAIDLTEELFGEVRVED